MWPEIIYLIIFLLQAVEDIDEIMAKVQNFHRASKRAFENIRNECRSNSQQGVDKESLKKMSEEVSKMHKLCASELVATKKFGEEVCEEITQSSTKLGDQSVPPFDFCIITVE